MKTTSATLLTATTAVSAAEFNVRDFGAVGDGKTKDTAAIQRAIDAAEKAGGGTVALPPGTYLSGSIFLKDNIDFFVMQGATFLASPDQEDYNPEDVCPQNYGYRPESSFGAHLFLTVEKKNVTVRGPGRIDGNSQAFLVDSDGRHYPSQSEVPWRPSQMLYFVESENLSVKDIELADSPYWSCFFHGCRHVAVRGANIHTVRRPHTYNGDGIDVDCCRFVTISDCRINTADDCITLRGNVRRLKNPQACEYVTVSNCTLSTPCNAVRVGVGDGAIRHAVFSNLVVHDTRTALNFFSSWTKTSRGVDIDNIRFANMSVDCQDLIRIQYGFATEARVGEITFNGISGTVRKLSQLMGRPGLPLENIRLSDIDLTVEASEFLHVYETAGLLLRDVRLRGSGSSEPVIRLGKVTDAELRDVNVKPQPFTDEELRDFDKRNHPY